MSREQLRKSAKSIDNLKAWLVKLTHNLCMDIQRKRRRDGAKVKNLQDIAFEFVFYFQEQQSYREIAEQLNISDENVRKRISQARKILRQQWNELNAEQSLVGTWASRVLTPPDAIAPEPVAIDPPVGKRHCRVLA